MESLYNTSVIRHNKIVYLNSSPFATEGRALGMTRGGWVIAPGGVQLVAPGENSKSMGGRLGSVAPRLPELLVKPHFGKIDGGHDGAELQ